MNQRFEIKDTRFVEAQNISYQMQKTQCSTFKIATGENFTKFSEKKTQKLFMLQKTGNIFFTFYIYVPNFRALARSNKKYFFKTDSVPLT